MSLESEPGHGVSVESTAGCELAGHMGCHGGDLQGRSLQIFRLDKHAITHERPAKMWNRIDETLDVEPALQATQLVELTGGQRLCHQSDEVDVAPTGLKIAQG